MLRATKGVFTLTKTETDTETETETEKMGTKPNGNLCWYQSLYSLNTSIQVTFLSVSVSVSGSVNTPWCVCPTPIPIAIPTAVLKRLQWK